MLMCTSINTDYENVIYLCHVTLFDHMKTTRGPQMALEPDFGLASFFLFISALIHSRKGIINIIIILIQINVVFVCTMYCNIFHIIILNNLKIHIYA